MSEQSERTIAEYVSRGLTNQLIEQIKTLRSLLGEAYNHAPPELRMRIGIALDGEDDSGA